MIKIKRFTRLYKGVHPYYAIPDGIGNWGFDDIVTKLGKLEDRDDARKLSIKKNPADDKECYCCGNCKTVLAATTQELLLNLYYNFCPNCGQRILKNDVIKIGIDLSSQKDISTFK